MPPVTNPPKNEIAQITIRITAMMYNKFPMLNYFFINDCTNSIKTLPHFNSWTRKACKKQIFLIKGIIVYVINYY